MSKHQDPDLRDLSSSQLRAEIMKLRHAIRKHRDATENARCWHNDLSLYAVLEEETAPGKMRGPEKILLQNCLRYIRRQQCSKSDCKRKVI